MLLRIKYTDSYETCTLHLFGGIDPTMTSHEIQGLNVVIRLKKLVASPHLWPRLQVEAERSIFVKNDYSVIMAEKEVKEEESYFNVYDDENSDTDSMEAPDLAEEQDDLVVAGEHDEDLKSDDIVMID